MNEKDWVNRRSIIASITTTSIISLSGCIEINTGQDSGEEIEETGDSERDEDESGENIEETDGSEEFEDESGENIEEPTASFTFSPSQPEVGQQITFDAEESIAPTGEIISYNWDFGDGETATGQVTEYIFESDGGYNVELTVVTDQGESASTTESIAVREIEDDTPSIPEEVHNYLSNNDAIGYVGMEHRTGEDEITVEVGSDNDDIAFGFSPVAVSIDVGTTVNFEWTGEGGSHNVVAADESEIENDAESELTDIEGYTYRLTFNEPGNFLYQCSPHVAQGMVGAVVVQ